jgi:peptidyl-prolyl cis-trans isomerase A (cyclophilin A)
MNQPLQRRGFFRKESRGVVVHDNLLVECGGHSSISFWAGAIGGEWRRNNAVIQPRCMKKSFCRGVLMKKWLVILIAVVFLFSALSSFGADPKPRKPGSYAVFDTTMGTFVCELYEKLTPETVGNFVGLVEGTKEWKNPRGDIKKGVPYFNGTIFHRVIKNFMIQAGDITGTGTFSPVPRFRDEFMDTLKFDRSGVLAMANSGPNTNGSQFFITVDPTPHLNGLHTIFGRVVEGYDVVEKISRVPVDSNSKPLEKVIINKITIDRVAKAAK